MSTTPWQELQPHSPFYLFVPQDTDLRAEYDRGWPVNEIFPVNSVGILTARDHLTIRWTRQGGMGDGQGFRRLDPEKRPGRNITWGRMCGIGKLNWPKLT